MEEHSYEGQKINPLALGAAYLDYCVRKGWLARTGEGDRAQYILTPDGEKKLSKVPFNFDLTKLSGEGEKKSKKRRRK
jgi:hypothetical protein